MKDTLRILTLIVVCLILAAVAVPPAAAQNKAAMPPELAQTIDEAVRLLEGEQYVEFLKFFAHPSDLDSMLKEADIEEIASDFKGEKAGILLDVLKSIRMQTPTLEEGGKLAVFQTNMDHPMVFVLIEGRWYLRN